MAFIVKQNQVIAFADTDDVQLRDQRVFDANEGLDEDIIEEHLIRATQRIASRIRSSDWWREYSRRRSATTITSLTQIPELNLNRVQGRKEDFVDLCVYVALSEYVYPSIADFSNDDNAERQKIGFFKAKADALFVELVKAGDWYDFDGDGVVAPNEKQTGTYNLKRVR
jgi:hypothetical protein